jgi:hypothetical protein
MTISLSYGHIFLKGESVLISPSYDITEFVDVVLERDYWDIIFLAEREATKAGRHLYRPLIAKTAEQKGAGHYTDLLTMLFYFLRNGVRPRGPQKQELDLFHSLCESVSEK